MHFIDFTAFTGYVEKKLAGLILNEYVSFKNRLLTLTQIHDLSEWKRSQKPAWFRVDIWQT